MPVLHSKPKLTINHASALAEQAREEIVALFTANMRTLYGLSRAFMRYLLMCTPATKHPHSASISKRSVKSCLIPHRGSCCCDRQTVANCSHLQCSASMQRRLRKRVCRLVCFIGALASQADDDYANHMRHSYEVQIDFATQGAGLGRLLMHAMEAITKAYNMHKVMLTVFKGALSYLP